jgi:PAS domain S-box-containing protein
MPRSLKFGPVTVRTPIDLGFLVGAAALIVVGWEAHRSSVQQRDEAVLVSHTYEVLRTLDRLASELDHASGDSTQGRVTAELSQLGALIGGSPSQRSRIDRLRSALAARQPAAAQQIVREMASEEQLLLSARRQATDASARRATTIIALSTVLALLLMAVALALLHDDLRRRRATEIALTESEAKYRVLMEQAADAILIVNSEAVCVEANAQASEILGRPQAEIEGLPLSAFVRGDGPSTGPVLPMLRYGHVTTGEFWVVRPDGSRVAVEIRATMLEDGRVQAIARDISERKEVERVKDEFVSVVSHELRTPLTSIRGALGLLASGRLNETPEKRQRMLELATSNADRLIRLVNDILDVERMSSGGMSLETRDLAARELVAQAVEPLRPIADRQGVTITVDVPPLQVHGDPDRLIQTITNLVDNAIKFSARGATVDVSATRAGRFAEFTVRDHGRGIPAEMRESVFNRFQQVDNSDSREKGGTGLGLAISRGIVEQHGGRIWIDPSIVDGTAFRFTIPLANEGYAAPGTPGTPQVLVIDDDPDLIEVLRTALGDRGYEVTSTRLGRDAIEQFDELGADVAVIDIALPDISGLQVLRHIHATSPATKIVVYSTTYLDSADKDFIRGIDATIVTKGRTSPDQLADEIDRLVSTRASIAAAPRATQVE